MLLPIWPPSCSVYLAVVEFKCGQGANQLAATTQVLLIGRKALPWYFWHQMYEQRNGLIISDHGEPQYCSLLQCYVIVHLRRCQAAVYMVLRPNLYPPCQIWLACKFSVSCNSLVAHHNHVYIDTIFFLLPSNRWKFHR